MDRVRGYIESQLAEACKGMCGIKVVAQGNEDCVGEVFPNPVSPGGTVTMVTEPCPEEEPEQPEEPDNAPDEPTSNSHG